MKTHTVSQVRLSPTTSYYIRKLLSQTRSRESININDLFFSIETLTSTDILDPSLSSSKTRTTRTIQKLEDLVFLHQNLHSQMALYKSYEHEVIVLEQAIFQILKNIG